MAEIVQQRIEDRIPELEQLERVGLFTRKEVKAMFKKASALEYKLHRRIISKEDFITYIQYEINVLELIKKRRSRIGYTFKREEIEFTIIHRINNVFRRATAKWKDDVQLWLSHIVFCKKWNTTTQLSKVFSSMLAIHPDKPAFWIMAAKWEMEDRTSSESARLLFLRALCFHPDNQKLYQEYFRMELMHAEKLRKEQKALEQAKMDLGQYEFSEEIMKAELARVIYKDAIQKIKGADFLLSFLAIARLFDFTKEMQEEILLDLQSLHADDPLTWDFMAKRELEAESLPSSEHESKQTKALEVGRREERCCAVYEEAVTAVPTEAMWLRYVTFCYERFKRKSNNEELKQKRREKALAVFQRAHESSLLAESLYKQWLQVLLAVGLMDTAAEVAIAAARRFSQSLDTWQSCLQVLVSVRSHDVPTLFEEALAHIKPKESLPLWILRVEWTEETQSLDDTEAFFQVAVQLSLQKGLLSLVPAISVAMKEKYLDWSYRTGGVKKAKKVFTSLQENRPFSLAFFQKMIQIEKEQETCKMQNLREYYERALREFGSEEDNLWLDYIKEELNHPQGKPENCGKIHWRAMRVLQGERVERFIANYTLAQTGHL